MSSMIQPISNPIPGVVQSPAVAGTKEAPAVQRAKDQEPVRTQRVAVDEYVPEEKQEPSGRYWLDKDENGQPKIYFDDLEPSADAPEKSGSTQKKSTGGRVERCTGSTDQVDREIERLRRRKEELERQISAQTDDAKVKALKQKLAQVERELSQKDNDTYRHQHTVFS